MNLFIQVKSIVALIVFVLYMFPSNGYSQNLYVQNAGLTDVNGYYLLDGTLNGKNKYTKFLVTPGTQYQIFYNGINLWYITPVSNPSDVLYRALSGIDDPIPPSTGWLVFGKGVSPAPILGSQPLPVELVSFTATVQENSVLLSWRTETEVENYGFEIQKALNPANSQKTWQTIGFVEGAGNSNSPKDYSYEDQELDGAGIIHYRLKQIDNDGSFTFSTEVEANLVSPENYSLEANYPNPFNPSTRINYKIAQKEFVNLSVYNLLGQKVTVLVNEVQSRASYSILFSADNLPGGIYFYKLETPNYTKTSKMVLLK